MSEVTAVYTCHKQMTGPYIDRGPRLLAVSLYENYRDTMRSMIGDVDTLKARVMPDYDQHVANDIAFRNSMAEARGQVGRATLADYPSKTQFEEAISLSFTLLPLPDEGHILFDMDEEDRAAVREFKRSIVSAYTTDLRERVETPLRELVTTLRTSPGIDELTGKRIGIFRDTKVTNVTEAVAQVRTMAMGDEAVLAMCDALDTALPKAVADNIDVLRESPVVREAAAKRLAAVADKMNFFFGGA
jgi:hypothetical protein